MPPNHNPRTIVSGILNGNLRTLQNYLDAGGSPDARYRNRSLLHWATQGGDHVAIRLLIANGANLEAEDENGHFPLYQAAGDGSYETVKILVEAGAIVDHLCNYGCALSIACAYEHTEVVRYLVSVGANPDLPDKEGATARSISESYKSTELLHILGNK